MKKSIVLIVEDEAPLMKMLAHNVEKAGYEVRKAKNGEEGMKLIEQSIPDLILLDILMPVMDGIEMLRKLRNSQAGKKIPVIILTNVNDPGRVADVMDLGVHDFIVKTDTSLEDIVNKVKEKLG